MPTPVFKRTDAKPQAKKDDKGKVVIKIYLQDPKAATQFPLPGNRKEEFALDDTTVGEVYDAVLSGLGLREDSEPEKTGEA